MGSKNREIKVQSFTRRDKRTNSVLEAKYTIVGRKTEVLWYIFCAGVIVNFYERKIK